MLKKQKKAQRNDSHKSSRQSINHKLDQVLSVEKKLLDEEKKIERKEDVLEREEELVARLEKRTENQETKKLNTIEKEIKQKEQTEEKELENLRILEQQIKNEVGEHPLHKISGRDVVKGFVGAFVGLAVHYTFTYGVEISENLDMTRATILFVLSFFVGLMFIYATGFRKIKDPKILMFMPIRLFVLYIAAILMSIFVLYLFYPTFGHEFTESYKMLAGVLLAAVVGACTADLIGKE